MRGRWGISCSSRNRGGIGVDQAAAALTRKGDLVSVAGETVAALASAQVIADFSYVSTAGGAFLEWLEGKKLRGVEALKKPRGSI